MYLFRPALSRKHKFPEGDIDVTCIYSKQDITVWFGGFLISHRFGWAGTLGFKDKRIKNIRANGRHSADFKRLHLWSERIDRDLS